MPIVLKMVPFFMLLVGLSIQLKQNYQILRKAGYTAIQTSPIQECLVGNDGNKYFGNWEFEYQPISQNI
eukprot:jgi/Orpsp1_1/1187619/evm.model.d7180000059067.1